MAPVYAGTRRRGRDPLGADNFYQRSRDGGGDATPLGQTYQALDESLHRLEAELDVFSDKIPEVESVVRRARQVRDDLKFIVNQSDRNFVYWLKRRGRGVYLQASDVDVSELLNKKLFDKVETCVLTSATLSSNGSFNFIRDRLGLDRAEDRHAARAVGVRLRKTGDHLPAKGDARPALAPNICSLRRAR